MSPLITPLLLTGLGLALIVSEALFPSLGLLSIGAAIALVSAISAAFAIDTATGVGFLVADAVAAPLALGLGMKLFPKTPMGKRMVSSGLSFESQAATDERDLGILGHGGEVLSPLRPAGLARIDGRRVDVVSRGELIDVGESIRVVSIEGNRVVVARQADPEAHEFASPAAPSNADGSIVGTNSSRVGDSSANPSTPDSPPHPGPAQGE